MEEGSSYAESRDASVSLLLMIRQFKDAVTTHFEASKDITPAISGREYNDFQEEGRRLSNQCLLLQRELPRIFDLTKGPCSELYPAMVRDYTAVSLYCLATAWNARPDLDNYGSPTEEGRQASHHDWKSLFGHCIAELQASFPNIGMTPNDIDRHLMIFRSACEEIMGEFPMADQQEARRREAEMHRTPHYHSYYGEVYMGDVFEGISHSTIVSRSTVEGAFNRLQDGGQSGSAKLLVEIGKRVSDANNAGAGAVYSKLAEELSNPDHDKNVVKSYWDGLVAILPSLADLSSAVIKAFVT